MTAWSVILVVQGEVVNWISESNIGNCGQCNLWVSDSLKCGPRQSVTSLAWWGSSMGLMCRSCSHLDCSVTIREGEMMSEHFEEDPDISSESWDWVNQWETREGCDACNCRHHQWHHWWHLCFVNVLTQSECSDQSCSSSVERNMWRMCVNLLQSDVAQSLSHQITKIKGKRAQFVQFKAHYFRKLSVCSDWALPFVFASLQDPKFLKLAMAKSWAILHSQPQPSGKSVLLGTQVDKSVVCVCHCHSK